MMIRYNHLCVKDLVLARLVSAGSMVSSFQEQFQQQTSLNFPLVLNPNSFFFILNAKIYNNILPITLPTKLLYDTTKTLPGGAICHDYPLAFNINLKKEKKKYI